MKILVVGYVHLSNHEVAAAEALKKIGHQVEAIYNFDLIGCLIVLFLISYVIGLTYKKVMARNFLSLFIVRLKYFGKNRVRFRNTIYYILQSSISTKIVSD